MTAPIYFKGEILMKKRLQGKKTRITILITLIVTALVDVLFRAVVMGEAALGIANAGEQVTVIAFAAIILLFTAKKNDKLSYISCGALIAYFVMDQLFDLPGIIGNLVANLSQPAAAMSIAIRILTMVGIVAIAALLAEYVNDGSIYNGAFNVVFWVTILLHVVSILISVAGFVMFGNAAEIPGGMDIALLQRQGMLIVFNDVYRIIMVLLFTSFAYDSAKRQLKRENLAK
jgi:hypothetical protein